MNVTIENILFLALLVTPCIMIENKKTIVDEIVGPLFNRLKKNLNHATKNFTDTKEYRRLLVKSNKAFQPIPLHIPFPCDLNVKLRSDRVPTNAHQVRPGDIDIVGNIGDSINTGVGISAISVFQESFAEERGRTFCGGGEKTWRTYPTLPNILKTYNPKLFGYALGVSQITDWASQFNVAENGAISLNLPFMVKELVKRIKNDPRVDFKYHWKMITIMMGNNDFCSSMCYLPNYYDSLENHKNDLLYVLRYLRDNLPRTLVNVVPPPRVDNFKELKEEETNCYLYHNLFCPCIAGLVFANKQKKFTDVMIKWQLIDLEVSEMAEFDLDDFTVIPHPFIVDYMLPRNANGKIDLGYLAPDCFHLSEKAHAKFGVDLWNSLLEPFGKKDTTNTGPAFSKFLCPSDENPYIYTKRNSR